MSWHTAQLGRTCFRTKIRDPRIDPDTPFLYVDISSIDRSLKVITSAPEILGSDAPSRARKEIREGDVLVSTVRPNLNAVAMVPPELDGQIASTGFCVLRPNLSVINGRYLFYSTTTQDFISILSSKVRGAHYPAVSDGDVKGLDLPLPALSEQRRIVEILDQADALRKKRFEADDKAAHILSALFYKMFGDPTTNAKGWSIKPLSDFEAQVRYGLGQPPKEQEGGVALIRATNISRGTISAVNMLYVNPQEVPAGRNAFLKEDEVLVVRSGAYTGDIAQVTKEWEGCVAGYDLVITPGKYLTGEFVEAYLLMPFIQKSYFHNLKARSGQPHLNAAQVAATPFPDVPRDLQMQFSEAVQSMRVLRKQRKAVRDSLEKTYSVMLHRAFTGDLTAKWREDHMKELLGEMEEQSKALAYERG
jgi:type I restriction enzyme S subunit